MHQCKVSSEEGITAYEDINDTHIRYTIKSLCWNNDITLKTTIKGHHQDVPMISIGQFFGTQVQKRGATPGKHSLTLGW